jgi:hypothetical protein
MEDLPRRFGLGAARPPSRVRYLQLSSTGNPELFQRPFGQLAIAHSSELALSQSSHA